ncbi:MAG TPA: hypothetical protein VKB62_09140 [Streptosporangiaceae bacterium]|nr:hypothetical protein [Streptosporangiaceae bacterium]
MSRTAGRLAERAVAVLAVAVVATGLLPVTLVAVISIAAARHGGWLPGRLYRAAAWCLPMLVVWLAAAAISQHSLAAVSPQLAWLALGRGRYLTAAVLIAPLAVPAGILAGGLAWSFRLASMAAQAAGRSPAAAVSFDDRQWRHQVRTAKALIAAPGAVPLLTRRGDFVAGAVIRAVGHPARELTMLPASRLRSHQIVIGATGTGKTTLLLRLWAGYLAAARQRQAARQAGPPLIVILDCKGGADARRIADRTRRVLRSAGAGNVAVWPDEARLSLWTLPARQLISTLVDLIEHGTGGAAYYTDVMEAVVALAVEAPCGAPASTADFLTRLDPGWLGLAYSAGGYQEQLALARSAARQVPDVALRFRTLFRRLGPGLDGPGSFADADVWYCILEGTAEVAVAEAQARALVDLLASFVTQAPGTGPSAGLPATGGPVTDEPASERERQVLLAVDEFSAVARRLPIWQLYERARSLGLSVQVSAQSWHGLAARHDDRYRLAATAEGGIWLLGTPHPDPVTALAGQRASVVTSRQLAGPLRWRWHGSSQLRDKPVADPDRIRAFEPGQAAYIHHGGVTFTQVKRLVAGPAALAAGPGRRRTGEPAADLAVPPKVTPPPEAQVLLANPVLPNNQVLPASPVLPDVSPLLDAAFGPPP